MANSVLQDYNGPTWPLGFIKVVTPGVPVDLMSLVDPSLVNAPGASTSATSREYTIRAQQIQFQAVKPGVSHGTQSNTGNVYIIRKGGDGSGSANRDDMGAIEAVLAPGNTYVLASAPLNRNVFNPYQYQIDADSAGDGVLCTLIIQ